MKTKNNEIKTYDKNDTTLFIQKKFPKKLTDLGIQLPKESSTKVISLRLPTSLYNRLKAYATNIDMPYQAYIKYLLNKGLEKDGSKQ